jgi:hypothetical protein
VFPTVALLADEVGPAKLVKNTADEIEYDVADIASGRVVFRGRCARVPGAPNLFWRSVAIP